MNDSDKIGAQPCMNKTHGQLYADGVLVFCGCTSVAKLNKDLQEQKPWQYFKKP